MNKGSKNKLLTINSPQKYFKIFRVVSLLGCLYFIWAVVIKPEMMRQNARKNQPKEYAKYENGLDSLYKEWMQADSLYKAKEQEYIKFVERSWKQRGE